MARLWQQIMKGEKGQALPIVLVLLVLGGLLIAPSLNFAATGLHAGQIVKENVRGVYAADAGIEDALWKLKYDLPPSEPYQLPENINQMEVVIDTENKGTYALYFGRLQELTTQPQQDHYNFLTVNGEMTPDGEGVFKYTITVTRRPEAAGERIFLGEVGVRLPVGYSYQPGSAASFVDNLSIDDVELEDPQQDGAGAYMLNWVLGSHPEVSEGEPPATQTFYVTGEGELEGDYTWVGAVRQDVGQVGEVIGKLYSITATARHPGDDEPTARVVADVIVRLYEDEVTGEISIILWQINPQ